MRIKVVSKDGEIIYGSLSSTMKPGGTFMWTLITESEQLPINLSIGTLSELVEVLGSMGLSFIAPAST